MPRFDPDYRTPYVHTYVSLSFFQTLPTFLHYNFFRRRLQEAQAEREKFSSMTTSKARRYDAQTVQTSDF